MIDITINFLTRVLDLQRPRSTMDSIRVSEAPDTGSIPVEAT